jgi:hypothetical protein
MVDDRPTLPGFAQPLIRSTDEEREQITRDYFWLTGHGAEADRKAFRPRWEAYVVVAMVNGFVCSARAHHARANCCLTSSNTEYPMTPVRTEQTGLSARRPVLVLRLPNSGQRSGPSVAAPLRGGGSPDGHAENTNPFNAIWNCRACNTQLGAVFRDQGIGRRTRQ